nr:ABC transporter ATP-binding protein [Gracilibacillus boraciitolerans]
MAGLQQPSKGKIILDNTLISSSSFLMTPEKRPINMVFQDYALWPHLTVQGNIFYGMKRGSFSSEKIKKTKSFLFELLQLKGLESHYPSQLSGGQQQRVAIARALATEPELLLLDEPLSNLDMQLRHEMRNQLSLLLRQLGTTVLHVTHDPLEAYALADRILILREGKIEQFDTPENVHQRPASLWVAGLLGINNRIKGKVTNSFPNKMHEISIGEQTIRGFGDTILNDSAIIVIDAEDIEITSVARVDPDQELNYISGTVKHAIYEGRKWRHIINLVGNEINVLSTERVEKNNSVMLRFHTRNTLIFEEKQKNTITIS